MIDVILMIVKIILIVAFSLYIGRKSGLFSLNPFISAVILAVLAVFFSLELYSSLIRDDILFLIVFKSSFLNFSLDLSFFFRIFLGTLILGLICSVFNVRFYERLNSAKDLCALAMVIAVAVVLGVYCTIRIDATIKISFKFIAVFVTSALFGPLWGGTVGAVSDIIAFFINPVGGVFLPQITMVEFLYGFTFGLFFYNIGSWQNARPIISIIICVVLQTVFLNLFLTSYFLMPLKKMSFRALIITRAVPALITMATQLVVLSFLSRYITTFRKVLK